MCKGLWLHIRRNSWKTVETRISVNYANLFKEFFNRCNKDVQSIKEQANEIVNGKVRVFGQTVSFNPTIDWLTDPITRGQWNRNVVFYKASTKQQGLADVKYILELNKLFFLVRVALAFYHTKDKKYLEYIKVSITGYRSIIQPYKSIAQRIMMDMGFRIINLVQVLLLCDSDPNFKKDTAPLINGIILDQVKAIEHFHTARWYKTGNGANHVIGEMIGLIIGQLWLQYCGIKTSNNKFRKEYSYLTEVINRTIAPSGAYLEQSGNYSRLVAEFLIIFDILKNSMGHEFYSEDFEKAQYKNRLLKYLRDISYNDYVPNFGDNDDARVLTAFRGKDEEVEYFLSGIDYSYNDKSYLDASQWVFNSQDRFKIHMLVRVGQFAYFREGASIHAHNDLLSVMIGINGQPVIIDKGLLYYNSGEETRKEYSQISAHNTIVINGIEMDDLGAGFSYDYPNSFFIPSDLNNSTIFSGALKYNSIEHKRELKYLDGEIDIIDTIVTNTLEEHGVINYLLAPDIIVNLEGTKVLLTLKDGRIIILSINGVEKINLNTVDYSPSYGQLKKTTLVQGSLLVNKNREKRILTTIEFG